MNIVETIIINASYLLTLQGSHSPRAGADMKDNGSIEHGAVAINKGKIVETGTTETIKSKYAATNSIIDAKGKIVLPGFVDSHTHLVFAGTREYEMELRLSGASYLDILKEGGGIHSTVKTTREMTTESLLIVSREKINRLIGHGTTTVEIKSGYGLEPESEEKILKVISLLKQEGPMDIITTFLGAHVIPKESTREDYISWLVNTAPKKFKDKAEFWDVFCEDSAYTLDESKKILFAAKEAGYALKIHAGQFNDLGGAGEAASLGAISADHLDHVSNEQLSVMKEKGTIALLLPGVPFYLGIDTYPDIKRFINAKVPIAIATDFNPGSCPSFSMQMMISLACLKMKMSAAEAITAATINAAYAVNRGNIVGSLEPGKKADIILLDCTHPSQIPYFFGTNLVTTVIKNGKTIWNKPVV